jgi:hypothetical protein
LTVFQKIIPEDPGIFYGTVFRAPVHGSCRNDPCQPLHGKILPDKYRHIDNHSDIISKNQAGAGTIREGCPGPGNGMLRKLKMGNQWFLVIVAGLLIVSLLIIGAPVSAITVTIDATPGSIAAALADPTVDTIIMNPGTYLEHNLMIPRDITIRANTSFGGSATDTIINAQRISGVFDNSGGHSLTIDNLTLQRGYSGSGGAIYNTGTATITSSTFTDCSATSNGGAIYNTGTATITSSTFTGCSATNIGGAIFNTGYGTITSSTFTGCSATSNGGAIFNTGYGTITSSTFTGCSATSNGGAIFSYELLTITTSTFTGCLARRNGGAIFILSIGFATATITSSTFTGCTAFYDGGAIYNTGTATIIFSRIVDCGSSAVYNDVGGTTHAWNNWWGTNAGPAGFTNVGFYAVPYLVLGATATPSSITTAQTSAVRANLTYNSANADTSGSRHVPDGIPVAFGLADVSGSLQPMAGNISAGANTTTFASTSTGTATITAVVDSQSVSVPVMVSPGPATHFAVPAPASATAGTAFSIAVTALDAYDNTATGYSGTVHFTSTDGTATMPADATLTNGAGTFSATLNTAGAQTITATDTVTAAISTTSGSITVGPGSAARFSISASTPATAGTQLPMLTVTALDAAGNTNTGYTGTVHFTSSDGAVTLPADYTFIAGDSGIHSFPSTAILRTAGTQTITATDTGATPITGASNTITVSPAAADHFTVAAPAAATAGTPVLFTVTASDAFGNTVTGYSGTVHFSGTDSAGTLPADATLTGGTGTFTATLRTTGSRSITATDTGSASITGTSGSIVVSSTVPTTAPTTTPGSGSSLSSSSSSGSNDDGYWGSSSEFPLMTVVVNIGGDSKAWQAIVTGTKLSDLIVTGTVQSSGAGGNFTLPPGIVFQYFSLVPARYNTITNAVINFTVPQSWLDENHIDPKSIVLYRLTPYGWEALPTMVLYTKDGTMFFSAQSGGFSLFAIAGTPTVLTPPGVVTTQELVSAPAVQEQVPAPAVVAKAPVTAQTTAPLAPPKVPAGSSPIPVVPALIGLICVGLVGGGWYVRRWWIRRQNPALFEEF